MTTLLSRREARETRERAAFAVAVHSAPVRAFIRDGLPVGYGLRLRPAEGATLYRNGRIVGRRPYGTRAARTAAAVRLREWARDEAAEADRYGLTD